MKNLNQMLANPQQTIQKASEYRHQGVEINENAKRVVDKALDTLKAIFPAWKHALPNLDSENNYKAQLIRAIVDAGIGSQEEVRRGVARARMQDKPFLPSTGEFISWCKSTPEDFGVPSVQQAYREACTAPSPKNEYQWSHPIVYHAGKASEWFLLATQPEQKAFPVFERNYDILVKRLMDGEEIEMPVLKALPEEVQTPITREENKNRMSQLLEGL